MIKLDIKLLDACKTFQWYVKFGCIKVKLSTPAKTLTPDMHYIGKYVIKDNMMMHFGKISNAEIQLGLKHMALKECLVESTGEIVPYDDIQAGKYMDLLISTKKPVAKPCDRESCPAYAICQKGEFPKPNLNNCDENGHYKPEILEEFNFIETREGFGNEYKYFINGKSFAGNPGFSNEQIHEQFKNKKEFKTYLERGYI